MEVMIPRKVLPSVLVSGVGTAERAMWLFVDPAKEPPGKELKGINSGSDGHGGSQLL